MDSDIIGDIVGIIIVFGPFCIGIVSTIIEKISELKNINKARIEIENKEFKLKNKEEELKNEQQQIEENWQFLKQYKLDIEQIATDNTQNAPWLAQRFADYKEIYDNQREQYLRTKQRPAVKSADEVRAIAKEKKELQKENKILKYQLDFIYNMFPFIENTIQDDVESVKEAIEFINSNTDVKDDYEVVSSYLSPEEYQKLSNQEKYQLALDRYLNRKKKSLWEIGISYERYIGYKYEMQGYRVKYNGALKRI